jgi:hypothetical protein
MKSGRARTVPCPCALPTAADSFRAHDKQSAITCRCSTCALYRKSGPDHATIGGEEALHGYLTAGPSALRRDRGRAGAPAGREPSRPSRLGMACQDDWAWLACSASQRAGHPRHREDAAPPFRRSRWQRRHAHRVVCRLRLATEPTYRQLPPRGPRAGGWLEDRRGLVRAGPGRPHPSPATVPASEGQPGSVAPGDRGPE